MPGSGFNPFRHLVRDIIVFCVVSAALGAVVTWVVMR